jgi:hypothetical protein
VFVPKAFVDNLEITSQQRNRPAPVAIVWRGVEIISADEVAVPSSVGVPVTLEAGGRLVLSGVLRHRDGGDFEVGDHIVTLNIERAVPTLESPSGSPWHGRYVGVGDIAVRVKQLRTAADTRRLRLNDAAKASSREDDTSALQLYLAMIRDDPSDREARAGAGASYMHLRRFTEAIAELELVLPFHAGLRSAVPSWLAYSYLALGEDQKAEAVLISAHGAEVARRELEDLRRAVRSEPVR